MPGIGNQGNVDKIKIVNGKAVISSEIPKAELQARVQHMNDMIQKENGKIAEANANKANFNERKGKLQALIAQLPDGAPTP